MHEITIRANGTAEFAYAGKKAWHGLGAELQDGASIEDWKTAAGLDWEVFQSAVSYQSMNGTHIYDGKNVLFRSDSTEPLSVVSNDYHIVQPGEVLEFFRDLTALHGYKLSAAGSLFGGRRFWATAETGKSVTPVAGDNINGFLLLVTSVDGTLSTQARMSSVRAVCNNTLTVALNENSKNVVKKTHASAWDARAVKLDMGLVDASWDTFSENIKKLTTVKLTDQDARTYLEKKFYAPNLDADKQSTQTYNKIQKLLNMYNNGLGAEYAPNTAYNLLNACTQYFSHGVRENQDPSRRFWEGSMGSWDIIKSSVYSDMLALAA